MSSTIQGKTIRPGGLRYSYYHTGEKVKPDTVKPKKGHFKTMLLVLLLIVLAPVIYTTINNKIATSSTLRNSLPPIKHAQAQVVSAKPKTKAAPAAVNVCAGNQLSQLILVKISARHLWACDYSNQVYSSPVVTGDEQYDDTLTPPGTYHIYAKQTNRTLTGSSELGNWDVFVHYWMPFLYNQYGAYGLHDATWRPNNAFGKISQYSSNASNGCVELPLATAQWLYNWSVVGTTVTIES